MTSKDTFHFSRWLCWSPLAIPRLYYADGDLDDSFFEDPDQTFEVIKCSKCGVDSATKITETVAGRVNYIIECSPCDYVDVYS